MDSVDVLSSLIYMAIYDGYKIVDDITKYAIYTHFVSEFGVDPDKLPTHTRLSAFCRCLTIAQLVEYPTPFEKNLINAFGYIPDIIKKWKKMFPNEAHYFNLPIKSGYSNFELI